MFAIIKNNFITKGRLITDNKITSFFKLLPLGEAIKEWRKFHSDCELGEEIDLLILMMDNPKQMAKEHTNAYLLCKGRIRTLKKVAKRLRKRGFNREADRVKEFIDRINNEGKEAINCRNCLVPARLHLKSYKGVGPVFDVVIKLASLKHDFESINRLRVR